VLGIGGAYDEGGCISILLLRLKQNPVHDKNDKKDEN